MKEYKLAIFLVSKLSGERVIAAIAENDITVSTMFTNNTLYSTPNASGASTILGITLQSDLSLDSISKIIDKILLDKKVPYFGYSLHKYAEGLYSSGSFPKEEVKEITSLGPYR